MKTFSTFLMVVMSCCCALKGTQTYAQDFGDDNATVDSEQLDATILQLREQLMKLEQERANETGSGSGSILDSAIAEPSAVNMTRSGNGIIDHVQPQQAIRTGLLPVNSTWLDQSIPTQTMPTHWAPEAVASPVEPVYASPLLEYALPAPIEQPVIVQQAPAPQVAPTIVVNIYQQAPAAQNNYSPPILAPIYGPAPIRVSTPRRGCCLFGRR